MAVPSYQWASLCCPRERRSPDRTAPLGGSPLEAALSIARHLAPSYEAASSRGEDTPAIDTPCRYDVLMQTDFSCELDHARATRAVLRVVVSSNRLGVPRRPLVRELRLCSGHARQLRQLGIEVIAPA